MPPRTYSYKVPTNPFLQVVYFIVGGIVLIGAVLMGAVILAIALGIAIVLGLVVYARVWWLSRKLRRAGKTTGPRGTDEGEVLEVEYTVVDERDEAGPRG